MTAERRHIDEFPARLHRRGCLRVRVSSVRSVHHDAYQDHSPAQNRQAIDSASRAFHAKTQRSSQDVGQSQWPQTAYASYISSKAAQVAEDAQRTRARIRRKRLTARKAL